MRRARYRPRRGDAVPAGVSDRRRRGEAFPAGAAAGAGEEAGPAHFVDYHDFSQLSRTVEETVRKANRPLGLDELLRITRLPRKAKKRVEESLRALQEEGLLVRAGGGWCSPGKLRTVEGVLAMQRAGMGFVTPKDDRGGDIFIHPAALGGAWHGDTVEVLVLPGKRGPSAEGRVSRVLRRSRAEVAAHATREQKDGRWLCVPADARMPALFMADVSGLEKPVHRGDLLLLTPGDVVAPNVWSARVTANLEHELSPAAQERLGKSNHGVPAAFSPSALAEADRLPENPAEEEFAGRQDLRHKDFVTIDGKTARDFDDAVCVEETGAGFRLLVAIADVARYVPEGSALDAEARLRGNSYYFPLSVEPMLPEALSNGLCSLRPGVPRLVMAADMEFSAEGRPGTSSFYPAVIQSRARLTYGQVRRGLAPEEPNAPGKGGKCGTENPPDEAAALAPVLPMLRRAASLARALAAARRQRGSLDLDLPEAEISVDDAGRVTGIAPRERHFAHRLIEEFMVAANEAVARFLEARQKAFLFRVHPRPDAAKMESLAAFLHRSGLDTPVSGRKNARGAKPRPLSAKDISALLGRVSGTPAEYTVNRMVLRSMMQARYATENEGHFGLASGCYCHFTSPIRRYADLTVHRALKDALGIAPAPGERLPPARRLDAIAGHINATERTAAEAEREVQKRLTILYLGGRVGETFDGVISGLTDFGMFVELPEVLAEGLVRFSSLDGDYYEFFPERQELRGRGTGRIFRLGQKMRVLLTDVSPSRLEINLAPERR